MSTLFSHFFQKINQISPLEADFTEVLENIALKPKTLYFCGKLPQNVLKNGENSRPKTVAIVGSRHNTKYGEEIAYELAYELGRRGIIVVSGLAYGIDSIGHRGCLDAGGTTLAVLGTRIDDIYPRSHLALAEEILQKNGAILSEYAPLSLESAPLGPDEYISKTTGQRQVNLKSSFLQRNRLISGLSDIVVIVEAAERSGTLNTAAHALAQGKTVFAVPGNITSPYSKGCNKLIIQGALPYTESADVLRELSFEENASKKHSLDPTGDSPEETKVLQAIARGARSGEEIMESTKLPPEIFNEILTLLEIKSRVRPLGLNNWSLA